MDCVEFYLSHVLTKFLIVGRALCTKNQSHETIWIFLKSQARTRVFRFFLEHEIRVLLVQLFPLITGKPLDLPKIPVVAGPITSTSYLDLATSEAWPQQKTRLYDKSKGLPIIRGQSCS